MTRHSLRGYTVHQ